MIDPKRIRTDKDYIAKNLARRGVAFNLDKVIELDTQRRQLQSKLDNLRAKKNRVSKEIGNLVEGSLDSISELKLTVGKLNEDLKNKENVLNKISSQLTSLHLSIPNLLHDSVPDGDEESMNQEIRVWGEPRVFDFKVKDHVELGDDLGLFDFELSLIHI